MSDPGYQNSDLHNPCAICGWGPHRGIHLPKYGAPAGSEPWGHAFVPKHADAHNPMVEGKEAPLSDQFKRPSCPRCTELERQRDELLAACRAALEFNLSIGEQMFFAGGMPAVDTLNIASGTLHAAIKRIEA